jgi:hypothetical protein
MEKKWIWLILFCLVAALGAYVTWSGGPSTPAATTNEAPKDLIANPDDEAPVLGGSPTLQPPVPGARKEGGFPEATSPGFGSPPPPGYSATPPNLETFAPPDGQRPVDPPTSFDPVPPQAFENPDFVTPPPPPTQFDSEPVPFDDEAPVPPPQGFDQNGLPIQPQTGDYDQPPGSPEGF